MNWEDVLNFHLINQTDELSGFQYYNICTKAALIDTETGEILASTKNFKITKEEFRKLIEFFLKLHSGDKLEFDHQIKISNEIYEVVDFDQDVNDVFLKRHLGGGVVSCANYDEAYGVLIVALFDEQINMKDIDGTFIKQNLEVCSRAVDKVRNFILNNKNKMNKDKLLIESDFPPSTSKQTN